MSPVLSQPSVNLPDLEPVRASWQRNAERYPIAQRRRQAPCIVTAQELSVSRAPVDELVGVAAEENDRLFAAVGKVGYALLFTAPDGVVVDMRGEPARIQQFKHWGIWQGGVWAESVEGTNGIGTCIAEKAPVTVHGSHHFRARHATLSCCGAPVLDAQGPSDLLVRLTLGHQLQDRSLARGQSGAGTRCRNSRRRP
jgi:transcriptional regulator of acetoin/glycerol metabolism